MGHTRATRATRATMASDGNIRSTARASGRALRALKPHQLKKFVSDLYLSGIETDRTMLAWMCVLQQKYMLPVFRDGVASLFHGVDLPYLLQAAITSDLATLLSFKDLLGRCTEEEWGHITYIQDEDDDDDQCRVFNPMTDLEDAILRNPEVRKAFPDLLSKAGNWAAKHRVSMLGVLNRADKRGIEMEPSFLDDVEAEVMKRLPADEEEEETTPTMREVDLINKYFTGARRDTMMGLILVTSGNPTCRTMGSLTLPGMALNLREAIVGLAGGLV